MTVAPDDLPSGWELATIAEVTQPVPNIEPTRQPDTIFNYIDISSIDNRQLEVTEPRRLTGAEAPSRAKRPVEEGDVLFSNVRTYLRNIARVSGIKQPAVASTGFTVLRPTNRVLQDFLFRWVTSDEFIQLVTPMQTGTHYPATSDRVVRAQHIPLPPLSEQRRIIDLLDRVDGERNAALFNLACARTLLGNFRRTVLSSACSGRLTEDWREAHPEARAVELKKLNVGTRRRGVKVAVDFDMPELPESYLTVPLSSIATAIEYGTSRRADGGESDVPILRMGNIQDGSLDLGDLKYITRDNEVERLLLRDGDLLFNRTNSPELVGKSAVWRGSQSATFASYLIRVRFHEEAAIPEFVNYWLNSAWGRTWARQVKTDGVSQSNINGTKLGSMPMPLPPLEEQREIVRRVEDLLKGSEEILAKVDAASALLERTGQAALAKAFRGELVH
jgi:type I restriction enzyme S subunit